METELVAAYQSAGHRIFFLDYDGTLVDLKPTPPEAAPTAKVVDTLRQLAADPRNTIVVISGRDRETLDTWLGDLPLHFAAEHGYWRKVAGEAWQATGIANDAWKPVVTDLMTDANTTCPGATLEEKASSLAWHYRNAHNPQAATVTAERLLGALASNRDKLGIRVINGNKVIEVQAQGTDKGSAAQFWLGTKQWDFILAAGDDITDEDLLQAMPDKAITIKIGSAPSVARRRIASPAGLLVLLRTFIA